MFIYRLLSTYRTYKAVISGRLPHRIYNKLVYKTASKVIRKFRI